MAFLQKRLREGDGFGHNLRELRELRGMTREQVSAITKIHASIIQALEEEHLRDLADPVYAERHVRTIVLTLEGRPGYFLKKYHDLLEHRQLIHADLKRVRSMVRRRDFFVTSHFMALVGFLLCVGLAVGYVIWQGYALRNAPALLIQAPQEGAQLATPHVEIRGHTDPTATVTVNGRAAVVDAQGQFFLVFDVPRGLTTLRIEARRRYGSSVTETRRVSYERSPSEVPALPLPIDIVPVESVTTTRTGS